MATQAVDVTTIFDALYAFKKELGWTDDDWTTSTSDQLVVFELFKRFGPSAQRLKHLKAKVSRDWQVLNKFLTDDGFDPMFRQPLRGIGAVSIIDMLVEWLKKAELCTIDVSEGGHREYPGFAISPGGYRLHDLGQGQPILVELLTKSRENLWLMQAPSVPQGPIDLIQTAFTTMSAARHASQRETSTVEIPEVSFNLKPDISFLCGALKTGTRWFISEAYQQFILKMNRHGARVKVATGMALMKGVMMGPRPLRFDKPFYLWFTQPAVPNLPIAIAYVDRDSWKKAGDLKDM